MGEALTTVGQAVLAVAAAGFGATLAWIALQLIAWIERRWWRKGS